MFGSDLWGSDIFGFNKLFGSGGVLNSGTEKQKDRDREQREAQQRELDKLRQLERSKKWSDYLSEKKRKAREKKLKARQAAKRKREQDACDAEMYRMMDKGPGAEKKQAPTLSRGHLSALSQGISANQNGTGEQKRAINLRGEDSNRYMTNNIKQAGFAPSTLKKF